MSRNLCTVHCNHCGFGPVRLVGRRHAITHEEAHGHYHEYRTMVVSAAECPQCLAKYLAWLVPPIQGTHNGRTNGCDVDDYPYYDLSYRSSFDDEPNAEDLPEYDVKRVVTWVRTGAYSGPKWD